MYLETILKIQKRKGSVRSIEIAEELGFSKPSVSRAVGIMKKDGFIVVHTDGIIRNGNGGGRVCNGSGFSDFNKEKRKLGADFPETDNSRR